MAKFIIIGLAPQGLSVLRMLSKAGYEVIAFTNKKTVGYYSKYGDKRTFTNIDELKKQIDLISQNETKKINCIITSGELLTLIISEYPELYNTCTVQSRPLELVRMFSYKDKMYDYANNKGLKYAKYKLLSDYKQGDLKFPVILKRNCEVPIFFKTKKIQSENELFAFIQKINKEYFKYVLVQEFINLDEYVFLTYQAYLHNGTVLGSYIGNQKRRLSIGLTSYLEEVTDNHLKEEVQSIANILLNHSLYTGFIEIELNFHPKTHEIIFMEVNTRPCGTHSVLVYKFMNLSDLFNNIDDPLPLIERENVISWINIGRDVRARLINKDFRSLTQFFIAKKDIFDWKDIKPFIMQFLK